MFYSFFLFIFIIHLSKGTPTYDLPTGGLLNIGFLCYKNEAHLNIKGEICDSDALQKCNPYFRICVSYQPILTKLREENCPVYFKKTKGFYLKEYGCNNSYGNINAKLLNIPLTFPLQNSYFIKIYIKDSNRNSGNDRYIGTFSYLYKEVPYSNDPSTLYEVVNMKRHDKEYKNHNLSLTMKISIRCIQSTQTMICSNLCQVKSTDTFDCSPKGRKICKEGFTCVEEVKEHFMISSILIQFGIPIGIFVALFMITIISFCIYKGSSNKSGIKMKKIPGENFESFGQGKPYSGENVNEVNVYESFNFDNTKLNKGNQDAIISFYKPRSTGRDTLPPLPS